MVKIEFTVKKAQWLNNPNLRWKAGLENCGLQFRQRLQRQNYPPPPPLSTYVRTGTLANKAGFSIAEGAGSMVMTFGSTFYLPYLLYGTTHWVGWPGKRDELIQYMSQGFKSGVKNYKEP